MIDGRPFVRLEQGSSLRFLSLRRDTLHDMDAKTQAWIDQHDAFVAETVRRYGWYIAYIGGTECACPDCDGEGPDAVPFAYTVGLFGLAHPELLVFGLDQTTTANILNGLGDEIRSGRPLVPGELLGFEEWPHRMVPELVPNPGDIVFEANRYYQRPAEHSVPLLQLSYDDAAGRFPWDDGFDAPEMQPRPGSFRA